MTKSTRHGVYVLLIAVSTGSILGRILAVNSVDAIQLEKRLEKENRRDWRKQRPFLSANDRSRWCTVRALVEHGTYAIDEVVSQPNWDTIDMVKHDDQGRQAPAADEGHLYSSKPPLLATLMAGEYWLIHHATGATLGTHPYAIGRAMIVTFNLVPLVIYFLVVGGLAERFGTTDWGRLFVMAAATFGTFLSTFAVAINNHLPAAVGAAITLDAGLRIWYDGERRFRWFAVAGFFAAFTTASELPALAFFAAVAVGLFWKSPRAALVAFVPAAAVVAAAALGTNWISHHSLAPPYAHRRDGDNWYEFQYRREGKVRDSYWSTSADAVAARGAIDRGEPDRAAYALHVLVGHHGIFSLTPIWLLSAGGMIWLGLRREPDWRALGLLLLSVSLVCTAFYLSRGQEDRNYGGMTSGFRWAFWFSPLWLIGMLPVCDAAAGRRWARAVAIILFALSVLSVSYPTWNPWRHPWLLDFLLDEEWVRLGAG
ncbi:MAG TPA: hypothetical protein VGX76_19145 [Pirellulales bacterium]|nr:hypothetical protein [Pirellulales bacterium]